MALLVHRWKYSDPDQFAESCKPLKSYTNIPAYKIVFITYDADWNPQYHSLYMGYPYVPGETIETFFLALQPKGFSDDIELEGMMYSYVKYGFHTFATRAEAEMFWKNTVWYRTYPEYAILRCCIPSGTLYYEGYTAEAYQSLASERLIIGEPVVMVEHFTTKVKRFIHKLKKRWKNG